jgi:hypothetical protein
LVQHLTGRALFDDDPIIHEDHPIGDITGKAHFMCDDDHRHSGFGEAADHAKHLADQLGSERRCGSSNSMTRGDTARARARFPAGRNPPPGVRW